MLLLLLEIALRTDQCVGPLATPPPLANGTLIHAQLIFRHGARTPGGNYSNIEHSGEWYCDDISAISPRFQAAPIIHPRNYHEKFDTKFMPEAGPRIRANVSRIFRLIRISLFRVFFRLLRFWRDQQTSTELFIQGMFPQHRPTT